MKHSCILAAIFTCSLSAFSLFAETPASLAELAKKQARSVHLAYASSVKDAMAVKGTITVTETQTNSYFCLFGWDCGYCGIQDLGKHGRVLIFSVWDPVDPFDFAAKPENVKEELRAKVLYTSPYTHSSRFGGEGTGAKTMTGFQWKVGEPVTLMIESEPDGTNRTAYTCHVQNPDGTGWTKLATLSTLKYPGHAQGLNGIYSFVEDFARNYKSATLSRRAEYSRLAIRATNESEWKPITRAMFSADSTPSLAIDAGRTETGAFFLQTGGETKNTHTRLWTLVD